MEGNEVEEKIVGDLDWDGLHRPRIYYAVATTFCGLFLSVLDGSICNVALPSIAREAWCFIVGFYLDSQCVPVGYYDDYSSFCVDG